MKTDDRLFPAFHQIPPRPSIVGRYCSEKADILGSSLKTLGWNHNRAAAGVRAAKWLFQPCPTNVCT